MKSKYCILTFLLLCTTTLLFADNIRFAAAVSKNEVGTGEQFEVDFSVNGNADGFNPPNFAGFQVLSGPNISTSMTSVNGNSSYSNSYSYILVAPNVGEFTIGPASITANGRLIRTNPIKIKVVKGQPVQQQNNQQGQAAPVAVGSTTDLSKLLFLKADVDKTNVYQGEQLTVSYKLYFRVDLLGNQVDKAPDLNGFWSQDIGNNKQVPQQHIETYKGIRYNVVVIKQTALFPEHSGNLVIDPFIMTFVARIPQPSQDIFDQVFGDNTKDVKVQIKSPPITIHVIPLPTAGQPANFGGAVGTFSVDGATDKKELKANESLNYTLNIKGEGNLILLNAPVLSPPADFEKYDPKVTDNISVTAGGISGSRQYNYLFIPRHQGDYTMAPVSFSYFNPATKRYVTLATKAIPVKVDKGIAETVTSFNAADQQDIKMLNKDIRYIKTSSFDLYKDGEGFYNSAGYYALLLLGPLLFGGAFFYRRWDDKQNSDIVKLKSRKANKIAAKHLANAKNQLNAGNIAAFYEAIAKGLYGYLSDKLNIPAADLNQENIVQHLRDRLPDESIIKQLAETIDLCEMARFAPISGISQQEVFEKAKNVIHEIEEKI